MGSHKRLAFLAWSTTLSLLSALCLQLLLHGSATAQTSGWPNRPLRFIVPFVAGSSPDVTARLIAPKLSEALGQPVLVENRGGAAGIIGAELVSKAAADGYTLLYGVTGANVIAPAIYRKQPYAPVKDLAPISMLFSGTNYLLVHPSLGVKSLAEFIALAKSKPGQLSYASSGNGALPHLAAALFNMMTGIEAVHVPYKGSGPALPDLIAGRTQYMIDIIVSALPQVQGGKLRALAVTTSKRYPTLPEIPTVAESGLPGYEAAQWYGLFAPTGTPAAIAKKIENDVAQLVDNKSLRTGLSQRGAEMMYGNSAQFSAVVKQDIAKWARVVKETGARAD